MQEITALWVSGLVFGLSGGLAPGPTNALLLAQSIRFGAREGCKVAIAPLLTDLPIVLAALALARWMRDERLLASVSAIGALVLAYLAVETWRAKAPEPDEAPPRPNSIARGMAANFFNPHPWMFWMTTGASTLAKGLKLGLTASAGFLIGLYLCLVGAKLLLAVAAARGRSLLSESLYPWLMRVLAVALLIYAGLLARDALAYLA